MNKNCFEKIKKAIEAAEELDYCCECGHVSNVFHWSGLSGKDYGPVKLSDGTYILDDIIKGENDRDILSGESFCPKCGSRDICNASNRDVKLFLEDIQPFEDSKIASILENEEFSYRVSKYGIEVSGHTNKGVEMSTLLPLNYNYVADSIFEWWDGFDVDEEINIHMQDKKFKENFSYEVAVEDFKEFEEKIKLLYAVAVSPVVSDLEIVGEVYEAEDSHLEPTACARIRCLIDGEKCEMKAEMFPDKQIDISVLTEGFLVPSEVVKSYAGKKFMRNLKEILETFLRNTRGKDRFRKMMDNLDPPEKEVLYEIPFFLGWKHREYEEALVRNGISLDVEDSYPIIDALIADCWEKQKEKDVDLLQFVHEYMHHFFANIDMEIKKIKESKIE